MSILSRISPFGPIFGKELRVTSRRKRTYFLRVGYLGTLLLLLLWMYLLIGMSYSWRGNGGSVAQRQMQQQQLGSYFFSMFAMFSVVAAAIISPVLTSTSIGAERLHKTLHVLLMTPITSWQIISGKLLSRLWVALVLIGLSLPVLAVSRLLGGVELSQVGSVLSLVATMAIVGASIGLFFSTLLNRAYAVILLSYATILFFYLFIPVMIGLLWSHQFRAGQDTYFWLLGATHPVAATAMESMPFARMPSSYWPVCVGTNLLLAAALVTASAWMVRRFARKEGSVERVDPTPAALPVPAIVAADGSDAPAAPANIPITRRARRSEVGDNPIFWREMRRPLLTRRWQRITATVICLALLGIVYGVLAGENGLTDRDTQIGFAIVFHGLVWLVASVLAATAIAQEKESDTWTVLLATPIKASRIVRGKVAGVMRRMLWPSVLIVGHFVLFTVAGCIDVGTTAVVLWVIFTTNALWVATGVYCSLRFKTVTFAVIMNLSLAVLLYGMLPLVLFVGGELARPVMSGAVDGLIRGVTPEAPWRDASQLRGEQLAELTLYNLPYYYLGMVVDYGNHRSTWSTPVFGTQRPIADLHMMAYMLGLGYLGAGAWVVHRTGVRFNSIVGRAEQLDDESASPGGGDRAESVEWA